MRELLQRLGSDVVGRHRELELVVAALGAGWAKWAAIAAPWAVFLVGWITAGIFTPSGTDNRPIRTHGPLDIEHDILHHDTVNHELAGTR